MSHPELTYSAVKKQAVDLANEVRKGLTDSFEPVQRLLDAHPIVFAVWQDPREQDGVGLLIVKGHHLMREIASGEPPFGLMWTAIPCISIEQAHALRQVASEQDRRH